MSGNNKRKLLSNRMATSCFAGLYIISLILGIREMSYLSSQGYFIPGLSLAFGLNFTAAVSFLYKGMTR